MRQNEGGFPLPRPLLRYGAPQEPSLSFSFCYLAGYRRSLCWTTSER